MYQSAKLDIWDQYPYGSPINSEIAHLVEHTTDNREVTGANPVFATK